MYFNELQVGMTLELEPAVIEKQKMLDFAHIYDNIPLHTNEEYAKCAGLIKAMLNFGGYAQAFTGRYTDSLANEGIEDVEEVLDFSEYAPGVIGELPDGISYYGMSVVLDSYIHVKHYFKFDEGIAVPDGFLPYGDYYYVKIDGFTPANFATVNTYTLGDWSISYCVLSYCHLASQNQPSAQMQKVISAMYNYYKQAYLYKNNV